MTKWGVVLSEGRRKKKKKRILLLHLTLFPPTPSKTFSTPTPLPTSPYLSISPPPHADDHCEWTSIDQLHRHQPNQSLSVALDEAIMGCLSGWFSKLRGVSSRSLRRHWLVKFVLVGKTWCFFVSLWAFFKSFDYPLSFDRIFYITFYLRC